jgi:acetyl esterase
VKIAPASPPALGAVDPGIERFLEILTAGNPAPAEPELNAIARMREAAAQVRMSWADSVPPGQSRSEIIETSSGSVPLTIHLPQRETPLGTLLFLHGGGWTIFDSETHAPLMRALAAETGWAVAGVDYPRAPEAPYPQPIEFCVRATNAVQREGRRLGLPGPVALAGDSSGANLAVATTLMMREAGALLPTGLMLFYGVYDCDMARRSYSEFTAAPHPLSAEKMAWFWDRYCPDRARRREPLASPLRADLSGLPPTFLSVAGQDILRDENLAMATRLAEAGVRVTLEVYPGAVHAFCEAVGFVAVSRLAVRRAAEWLADSAGDQTRAFPRIQGRT